MQNASTFSTEAILVAEEMRLRLAFVAEQNTWTAGIASKRNANAGTIPA